MQYARESTVLIVDDEPEIRRLASAQLQEAGYATVEAATAEQALVVLDESAPDVILLDLEIPGMGGLDFLKEIRADDPASGAPPVIAFSAYLDVDPVRDKTVDLGCSGHVLKPYDRAHLLKVIASVIDAQSE